jgi:hypothetical protein
VPFSQLGKDLVESLDVTARLLEVVFEAFLESLGRASMICFSPS